MSDRLYANLRELPYPGEFRFVPEYGFNYAVDSYGHVVSFCRSKPVLLRPGLSSNGYYTVSFGRDNSICLHTLVMITFVGPKPKGYDVDHIDGDRLNNSLDNLRYVTRSENIENARRLGRLNRKLNDNDVLYIFKSELPYHILEKEFDVSKGTISSIKTGRTRSKITGKTL